MAAGGPLYLHAPAYSTDGQYVIVPCGNRIKLYSTETALLVRTIAEHSSNITCIRPFGSQYYSCSVDGEIVIFGHDFDIISRQKVDVPLHQIVPLSSSEILLVSRTVGTDKKPDIRFCKAPLPETRSVLYLLDANGTFKQLGTFTGRLFVESCNGNILYVDRSAASFCTLHNATLNMQRSIKIRNSVTCMQADSEMLIFGDDSGRITIWHYETGNVQTLHWHSDLVTSVALLPSGQLLSGGKESVLVLWRIADQQRQFLPKIGEAIVQIAVRSDYRQFAVSTKANRIVLVDSARFRECATIEGIAGLGSSLHSVERLMPLTDSIILNIGPSGSLQAYDFVRDRQIFSLQVIDLLLTDPSSQSSLQSHPKIETFTVSEDQEWIVTAEGRSSSGPHLGYIKMWSKDGPSYSLHTVIHNPHIGSVVDLSISKCNGQYILCSVSNDDTFKLYRLETVYDQALCKNKFAWRVLYADPLNGHPSSCCLRSDGMLLVTYRNKVVLLDINGLVTNVSTSPQFIQSFIPSMRLLRRVAWLSAYMIVACTDRDVFGIDIKTGSLKEWNVRNTTMSVNADKLAIISIKESEHWLLKFDSELNVVDRKQLDGAGRAVLVLERGTLFAFSDGYISVDGVEVESRAQCSGSKTGPVNVLAESLKTAAQPKRVVSSLRAKPVRSRNYLYPLVCTRELPSMSDIFRSFILPRLQR